MGKISKLFSITLATGLGSGYLPLGPGTWGSLVMAVFCWWLFALHYSWYLLVLVLVFALGIMVVPAADAHFRVKTKKQWDNQTIVIDEWFGILVAYLPLLYFEITWWWMVAGFILFRFFDIFKFGIAKKTDHLKNKWGVMLDDFFAGLYAAIVLTILLLIF